VKKILAGLMIAVLLTVGLVTPMMANAVNVTVTAQPAYIFVENTPGTWTINGVINDGFIEPDTLYYSIGEDAVSDTTAPAATVNATSCLFDLTDSSSVNITLQVTMEDFTGGIDNMSNAESASNGATSYAAQSYYSGMTYADKKVVKVVANLATTDVLYTSTVAGGADISWGVVLETQEDAWTGADSSTATLTITAAKA